MKQRRSRTRTSHRQALIEWVVVALMVLLCGGLTALQYRWTGEVGRAEVIRLRAGLEDQVKNLCQEFDTELRESYEQLVPSAREIETEGRDEACLRRFNEWNPGTARPLFRRIAMAVPTNGSIQLLELDQREMRLVPAGWPQSWISLRENLGQKLRGPGGSGGPGHPARLPRREERGIPPDDRRGPLLNERRLAGGPDSPRGDRGGSGFGGPGNIFYDAAGRLVEFPVFFPSPLRNGISEMQWMIFELDMDYLTNSWLPELVSRYLNVGGRIVNDVAVNLVAAPRSTVFTTAPGFTSDSSHSLTLSFNPQFGMGRMRGERKGDGRWNIQVSHRSDALEEIVAASRRRNLGLAVLLNGLMLASGIFLVQFTRRSRQLAEQQLHFVANVSHELRTPLTVIQGAGENLARGIARDPEAVRDYSRLIIQHANQLKAMVEQVLAFAAAQKRQPLSIRPSVALGEILSGAVAAVTEDIEAAECEVKLEVPPDLPLVRGDALALGRAFQNLISNAAKHGSEGKWIGITACSVPGARPTVEVNVSDRGAGISREEQREIFKPFVRGAHAQQQAVRGSGLGLSVVQEIVEAHGGDVSILSAPDQGTTFIVRLPAQDQQA